MPDDAPYHAHIYYSLDQRRAAETLRDHFQGLKGRDILFVGRMMDEAVGPHPTAHYEVHFREPALDKVIAAIKSSELRALVHPLTDDDLADHTELGHWIGEPLDLDLTVLDPPGHNPGIPRFGKTDF